MTVARIAPTVAPPSARALLGGASALLSGRSANGLTPALEAMFAGASVTTWASGRAALAEAIGVAMRATGRRRVVLPAFTSWSVAAAAAHAGAVVDLCDLDPVHWDLDRSALRALVGPDTAAVVLGNLYGTPDRTADLGWLADAGVPLIDDAAQAFGARETGRGAGTRGALGVLSFGRGKCVTLGDAGALLVWDSALRSVVRPPEVAPSAGLANLLRAAAMTLCTNPLLFGLLSRLPGGRIGESWYEPAFTMAAAPASANGLAADLVAATERQLAVRRRVAGWWDEALAGVTGLERPHRAPGAEPAFLRLPVLAADRASREELVARLDAASFSFVRSFPDSLGGIPAFRRTCRVTTGTPFADDLAGRLLTLPCHAGVHRAAIERAARVLHR